MKTKIKTTIDFPLAMWHNFPCKITVETKFVSGTPSEFELRNGNFIDKLLRSLPCEIKNIKIQEVYEKE